MHYNSAERFSAPWIDAGMHKTETLGWRRLWLLPPETPNDYWKCAIAGAGSTAGDTREAAIANALKW